MSTADDDLTIDKPESRWSGKWFIPELHKKYQVPINVVNNREHRGRVGKCIGRRSNGYGMSWALIEFDDDRQGLENIIWIRTRFLVEVKNEN